MDMNNEYMTLRQEILNSINPCDTYKIAMYTITVAILGVAFSVKEPLLFMLPYIALPSFQWSINKRNENNITIAAYIAVFLEKDNGWESNNAELKKVMRLNGNFRTPKPILSRLIGRIGSAQIGLVCSLLCILYSGLDLYEFTNGHIIKFSICVVLSVTLYISIRVITKDVLKLGKRKEKYIENLKSHIKT